MFVKYDPSGKMAIFIVYLDGIIITKYDTKKILILKEILPKEFEFKNLKDLKYFLGIEIAR